MEGFFALSCLAFFSYIGVVYTPIYLQQYTFSTYEPLPIVFTKEFHYRQDPKFVVSTDLRRPWIRGIRLSSFATPMRSKAIKYRGQGIHPENLPYNSFYAVSCLTSGAVLVGILADSTPKKQAPLPTAKGLGAVPL